MLDKLTCTVIRLWQDFLDSLNTDGGHILLLAIFVVVGVRWSVMGTHEELFLGALIGYLKAAGSNKTRRDRPSPTTATTVQAAPTPASLENLDADH